MDAQRGRRAERRAVREPAAEGVHARRRGRGRRALRAAAEARKVGRPFDDGLVGLARAREHPGRVRDLHVALPDLREALAVGRVDDAHREARAEGVAALGAHAVAARGVRDVLAPGGGVVEVGARVEGAEGERGRPRAGGGVALDGERRAVVGHVERAVAPRDLDVVHLAALHVVDGVGDELAREREDRGADRLGAPRDGGRRRVAAALRRVARAPLLVPPRGAKVGERDRRGLHRAEPGPRPLAHPLGRRQVDDALPLRRGRGRRGAGGGSSAAALIVRGGALWYATATGRRRGPRTKQTPIPSCRRTPPTRRCTRRPRRPPAEGRGGRRRARARGRRPPRRPRRRAGGGLPEAAPRSRTRPAPSAPTATS